MLSLISIAAIGQAMQSPTLQPGSTEAFQRACVAVEEKLEVGDFKAAAELFQALPKEKVRIEWDDSKLTALQRTELRAGRDSAFASWKLLLPELEFTVTKPADIRVTFVPSLPPNADTPIPAGAVHFVSPDPKETRIETVIALQRGNPPYPVEAADVHNEVGHAIGLYFGIARTNHYGSFSSRSELGSNMKFNATPYDAYLAKRNLEAAQILRKLIHMQVRATPAKPRMRIDPPKAVGGTYLQGDKPEFSFQLSNIGNAPLLIRAVPDCGCVITTNPGPLAPGATTLYKVKVDTTEFVGKLDKKVLMYTNDPEEPMRSIGLSLEARPLYRILTPNGTLAIQKPGGATLDFYLALPEGSDIVPMAASAEGAPAKVAFEKWSGRLSDPELNEPESDRSGYRFTVRFDDPLPPGRLFSAIRIETNSPKFPLLRAILTVQTGIVAMPEQLTLGAIPKAPRRAFFILSRPGRPFKVLGVRSDDPNLSFEHRALDTDGEHRITVQIGEKLESGLLRATIVVRTDDPVQNEIRVPLRAEVQ